MPLFREGSSSSNGEQQNKGLAQSKSEQNIIEMKFKSDEDIPKAASGSSGPSNSTNHKNIAPKISNEQISP
jgi:hypothetical protein